MKTVFRLLICLFGISCATYLQGQANVALGKSAKQSTTFASFTANFAVDGDTRDRHTGAGNNYTTTNNDANTWWEVDLGENYDIIQINVFNVTDKYGARLRDLNINVSSTPFTSNTDGIAFASNVYPSPMGEYKGNATGRYVRVHLKRADYLNLCEVQVIGSLSAGTTTSTNETWNFQSGSNHPLEISANGKVVGTLNLYGKTEALPVGIGDVITVKVIEEDQVANRNKLGHPPITINDGTENPLRITVKREYSFDDARSGLRDDYIVNFHGIDLTEFKPFNVGESFKTSSRIFDGLRIGTYMYDQLDDGTYVPTGFINTGKINSGDGNYDEKTIIGEEKMKEAWSLGAQISATIPLDQSASMTAKPTVAFNYGESEVENSSESDVFITSSERKVIYNLEINNLDRVILHLDFIEAIKGIETLNDAHEVVSKYGTHYTDKVNYGGEYHTMIRIHEDSYYKANSQNWDLSADIAIDKSGGPKTTTRKPNNQYDSDEGFTDTESGGGSSALGSGKFSFKHQKDQSHKEVYGNIESEYWYRGGSGNINSWSADGSNALAIQVGNLIYISELVKPNIFKTDMTEANLKPKRDLLKLAIDQKLQGMTYLNPPNPYRSFHYRIKSVEYVHYNDDANTRIKGNISARLVSNGVAGAKETLWDRPDWSEENIGGLTDRQGLNLKRNALNRDSWIKGKQEGYYQGTGIDAKKLFKPLQIKFEGSITDKDDCCFNTGHDLLEMVGTPVMTIKDLDQRQYYTFELDHFFTHVEKMRLKVTIEVVPLIGF